MAVKRLIAALRAPESVVGLDAADWTALICVARNEQLVGSLAHRVEGQPVPPQVVAILEDARRTTAQAQVHALWEAEMAHRALAPEGIPLILLKGTAFAAAGLVAGEGRFIGDLDIIVPRDQLGRVEQVLLGNGWEWLKPDPYDDAYYRQWMHELPPLIHNQRGRMIDVHHTILPPTARPTPDAAAMIADSVALENGMRVFAPNDMIVHAAAHLFADGDLAGGLRNLWDIDRLLRQFGSDGLLDRARHHQLLPAVTRALRLSAHLYGTPVAIGGLTLADRWFVRRLLARDDWGRQSRKLTRLAFYIRSHWMRMPPLMLARHLWIKLQRGAD